MHAVALPRLQIPTFSGKLRDWTGFWDHFYATIRLNNGLRRIEKFKYLLTYLTDRAKQAVEGIRLSGANYDVVGKILQDRFGRSDMLVDEHIDQLLALPPIRSSIPMLQVFEIFTIEQNSEPVV